MGIERIVLEHHGDVALGRFQVIDHTRANRNLAVADFFQPGDHAQQGGFAAARGADDDDEFAVGYLGVDPVDDLVGGFARAVAFDDVLKSNRSHFFIFQYPRAL